MERRDAQFARNQPAHQRRSEKLESQFEDIRRIDFTLTNIEGFLLGLVEQQADMQIQMLLDCFDIFSKYHVDNRVHYKGWKSNSRHRTQAFKLKMSRIILPASNRSDLQSWGGLGYSDVQAMADIDKAFALLDGKHFGGGRWSSPLLLPQP